MDVHTINLENYMENFTCPFCGSVSYNYGDIKNRYCGRCQRFVDDPTTEELCKSLGIDFEQFKKEFNQALIQLERR
jgi:hypothetical protein